MPFSALSSIADAAPLRILLINAGADATLTLAGVAQPLRLAARSVGAQRLQVDVLSVAQVLSSQPQSAWPLMLVVADEDAPALPPEQIRQLIALCRHAQYWGAVGAAVLWFARAAALDGVRTALPWALYAEADALAERAILPPIFTPNLYEIDGNRLTCCGGAASTDFSLCLVEALFGTPLQAHIKEALCIERVRGPEERQRVALQARFGVLQPKLSEAVALMEANIAEPLATDDIANLVGISRRQLERLFKQHLGSLPSRYYLELRLQRARQLLNDSHHSIVQIGLMCGFSSGSHFSTAFSALFEITPREERQRKLKAALQ
jgi:transcriptional regulator GlxA family with amidase domain